MALSKKAQKEIEGIIAQFKAYMKFRAIGPTGVTRDEMKELIRAGLISAATKVTTPSATAYLETHQNLVEDKAAPRNVRDGALDFLERMHKRYIEKMGDQVAADIQSTIEGNLMPIKDRREGALIYEAMGDKKLHSKNLSALLHDKVQNWRYRYKTIVSTELNRASNWGAMDAVLHNNPDKHPAELVVYKQGNKPGHGACKYCEKFWYMPDGITPKVYTMAELLANGSNIGKKAKDWLPTIDSTHPNETHQLRELKPGFGFNNGGEVNYIGKDYDEYKKQKGN